MSQIIGTVKEIFEGVVSKGRSAGKPFWSITLDTDTKLTTFNEDYVKAVEVGKEYTFTVKSDGTYTNLTAPTVPVVQTADPIPPEMRDPQISPSKEPAPSPKNISKGYGYRETEADYRARQLAIRKAVALKAGVEYAVAILGGTGKPQYVIDYAREFEKYLEGESEGIR